MPIPNPKKDESKDAYISRCMSALKSEKRPHDQKVAICHQKWRDKGKKKSSEPKDLIDNNIIITRRLQMESMEITLNDNFEMQEGDSSAPLLPLMVKGVSCRAGYIKKKHFIIPDRELTNIASTLKAGVDGDGAYILKDHGGLFGMKGVDALVGRITNAVPDGRLVLYRGRIEDEDMADKIRKKLISSSSIGMRVNKMTCSICGLDYGDPECTHRLGEEYPDEGLHESAVDYLGEMGGKPLAAIVGGDIVAKEQSIVLFPAIDGASVGFNFNDELEKFVEDIELQKEGGDIINIVDDLTLQDTLEEIKTNDLIQQGTEVLKKFEDLIEGFNKEVVIDNNDTNMSVESELEKLAGDLADAKANNITLEKEKGTLEGDVSTLEGEKITLESNVTDLEAQLGTANEVIKKYKDAEDAREAAVRSDRINEAVALREELEFEARDYSELTLETIDFDIKTLKEVTPKTGGAEGHVGGDDAVDVKAEEKEDVREMIFGVRRDGKPKKGIIKWSE